MDVASLMTTTCHVCTGGCPLLVRCTTCDLDDFGVEVESYLTFV